MRRISHESKETS